MSFILDALKKSEGDRQRQSGPALFEVKVAAPRSALPLWAVVVAALLLVNLAIVGWMLLKSRGAAPPVATGSALPGAEPVARTASAPAVQGGDAPTSVAATPTAGAPASPASSSPAAPPSAAAVPSSGSVPQAGPPTVSSATGPTLLTPPASRAAETPNPEDYAPAAEPPPPLFGSRVQRGTVEGVPLYQDAAAAPGSQLPQLRLDLHVYAAHAQDRFVMINMQRLREGDSLQEGVRVESITADGAVLSYNGSRFLLTRN